MSVSEITFIRHRPSVPRAAPTAGSHDQGVALRRAHLENLAARRPSPRHVSVLLALYNGAHCLPDQLHSFKRQTHTDWSLIVSDDGSRDQGPELINCFARAERQRKVTLIKGPGRGFAMNFLHLMQRVERDVPYAAFSDQDDAWLPQKLERGLAALGGLPADVPGLYCGRTWICSRTLRKLRPSPRFRRQPGFRNAIVQNIGGGNTMILNAAAVRLVQKASRSLDTIASHDWWTYQLVSGAGGRVVFDDQPMVLYRQHDSNVIGAGDGIAATLNRLRMVLAGTFQNWNEMNERALAQASAVLTPENRTLLSTFRTVRRTKIVDRIRHLRSSGIHHQTRLGNMGLWLAAVLNRI